MFAIKTTDLVKKYKEHFALKNINFEIKEGDFFALLGVNGAGKTTIIGILIDLVTKTSGKVEVFGVDIDDDFAKAKKMIGVVPQEFNLDIFARVIDVLISSAGYYGIEKKDALPKAIELLEKLGLSDKQNAKVGQLSGGMKRRVMIARALMHSPKLLILDEPTAGIDINLRKSTYEFLIELNKKGMTILLTTHYLEEVEKLCNSLAVIKKGEIIINSSKKEFFAKMENYKFEIELKNKINSLEELKNYEHSFQENSLIIFIPKEKSLNEVFHILNKNNIEYVNVKNITNELEELFETLTN
ncbi:MAG: ABC transporter ATP-binding protein [Candidatus Altimarinota bacterium]